MNLGKSTLITFPLFLFAFSLPGCRTATAPEPTMPIRGYQLDISRMKVPTMATLYRMVDILAALDYNQFQLYTEHAFAYPGHEAVWEEFSPMTADEIRALDKYCAARGIELVPNQNSFGHLDQWLCRYPYNELAEVPQGGAVYKPWGNCVIRTPSALCPTDARSIPFIASLYDALFPCFKSKLVNVGCDETLELEDARALNRSAKTVAEKGVHRVYLDFLLKIHREVASRGHTMMFWGDIIVNAPELVPELPEEVIALCWGYEGNHPFDKQCGLFAQAKRRFMVCPGTSAWGSISGRVPNMIANIDNAYAAALKHGAEGMLLADWGDGGHPNPWIVSIPALVYFSAKTHGRTLSEDELAMEIDRLLGCTIGAALLEYGKVYETCGARKGNSTELFLALSHHENYTRSKDLTNENLAAALRRRNQAVKLADLNGAAPWISDDFQMLDLLYRAVALRFADPDMKNFRARFEPEYRALWLKQNRPGGLSASLTALFGPF